MQTRPTLVSLVCSSYPSDRDFASDFLQILPHDRHPCHWLVVPTTKPTTDFHRQVVAHAGHTYKKEAFDKKDLELASNLYIELEEKMEELRKLYSSYKRNLLDI